MYPIISVPLSQSVQLNWTSYCVSVVYHVPSPLGASTEHFQVLNFSTLLLVTLQKLYLCATMNNLSLSGSSSQGDGEDLTDRIRQLRLEALCFLNIPSHGGGTNPWGTPPTRDQVCLSHCMDALRPCQIHYIWTEKEPKKKILGNFHNIFDQNMVLFFFSLEWYYPHISNKMVSGLMGFEQAVEGLGLCADHFLTR